MTAVGGPDVLQVVELPEPEVSSEHDVVVRLRAAGINPVDYKLQAMGQSEAHCLQSSVGTGQGSWRASAHQSAG